MVDFNIEEKVKNGLDFKSIFRSLILYSVSLFIAFWWADFLKEIMDKILPKGEGIILKACIGIVMTICLVFFAWFIMRSKKKTEPLKASTTKKK